MYRIALLLSVVIGVAFCDTPSAKEKIGKSQSGDVAKSTGIEKGTIVQKDVLYITGNLPSLDEPVEYFYVTKDHILYRKDQGIPQGVRVANDVVAAYTGWDNSLWYLDISGEAFRLDYNETEPDEVPNPVPLVALAPVLYGHTWAVANNGSIFQYIANKWSKLDSANGTKLNFTDISVGIDGVLLGSEKSTKKIWIYWYPTREWRPYEKQGIDADIADVDHVVVIKGADFKVMKKVQQNWTDIPDKCQSVSAFDESEFFCTTPNGEAKLLKF